MTRRALEQAVAALGGTYAEEANGRWRDMRAEAPAGFVWSCRGVHEVVGGCYAGPADWAAVARDELAEDVRGGVSPCEEPDCEWCEQGEQEAKVAL